MLSPALSKCAEITIIARGGANKVDSLRRLDATDGWWPSSGRGPPPWLMKTAGWCVVSEPLDCFCDSMGNRAEFSRITEELFEDEETVCMCECVGVNRYARQLVSYKGDISGVLAGRWKLRNISGLSECIMACSCSPAYQLLWFQILSAGTRKRRCDRRFECKRAQGCCHRWWCRNPWVVDDGRYGSQMRFSGRSQIKILNFDQHAPITSPAMSVHNMWSISSCNQRRNRVRIMVHSFLSHWTQRNNFWKGF